MPSNFINKMIEEQRKQLCAYIIKMTSDNGGTYLEIGTPNSENHQAQQEQQNGPAWMKSTESMIFSCIVTSQNGESAWSYWIPIFLPVDATVNTLRVQLISHHFNYADTGAVPRAVYIKADIEAHYQYQFFRKNAGDGQLWHSFWWRTGYKEIADGRTLNYAAGELSKVETLRRDLGANISHDLRTPLTMITGYSEVMRDLPGENTPENVQRLSLMRPSAWQRLSMMCLISLNCSPALRSWIWRPSVWRRAFVRWWRVTPNWRIIVLNFSRTAMSMFDELKITGGLQFGEQRNHLYRQR